MQHFLPRSVGRIDVVCPHENDFACMWAQLSNRPCAVPLPAAVLSEPIWAIQGTGSCYSAIESDKSGDGAGFAAEL